LGPSEIHRRSFNALCYAKASLAMPTSGCAGFARAPV
jgi:hypothetical protein